MRTVGCCVTSVEQTVGVTGRQERERERERESEELSHFLQSLCNASYLLAYVFVIYVFPLTLRRLMSYIYIYGAPILDVSRSHTTTQHSR